MNSIVPRLGAVPSTPSSALPAPAGQAEAPIPREVFTRSVEPATPLEHANDNPVPEVAHSNALALSTALVPGAVGAALGAVAPPIRFSRMVSEVSRPKGYQQTAPQWVDPLGDAHLIRRLDGVPLSLVKRVFHKLTGKMAGHRSYVDKPQASEEQPLIIGHQRAVRVDALLNRFVQIIQEHPDIEPTLGQEHKWSPQASRYLHYGFWQRLGRSLLGKQGLPAPLLHRTKLFYMLAVGNSAKFAITGKEAELEARLMSYPDRSVRLEDVLQHSYLINRGNLYNTLLTAENVLARDVRDKRRDEQPVQRKLQYIRNDSVERGDNFGAWYHFMGVALYSMMRPQWMGKSVAIIEGAGSYLAGGTDRQEDLYNCMGAEFGAGLRRVLDKGSWRRPLPATASTDYMTLNEFKTSMGPAAASPPR